MNLKEFVALKAGDKVRNDASHSEGTVTETNEAGVRVRWGVDAPGKDITWAYTVAGTSWFHWSRVEG